MKSRGSIGIFILIVVIGVATQMISLVVDAFQQIPTISYRPMSPVRRLEKPFQLLQLQSSSRDDNNNKEVDDKVEVGSKEYLKGFVSSPIKDETVAERGSGLEQALKLGGGVSLILIALVVAFLASNGLI